MTEYLYHLDSYLKDFSAKVVVVDSETRAVTLDRTVFYPGGGGQPCDMGILAIGDSIWQVQKTRKVGLEVEHVLAGEEALPLVGATVEGKLDWERRYRLMRTHTAMHILCGVIFRDFGAHVTGGDMDLSQARMDFEFESMTHDLVKTIEESVNREG
jgi:misacylated tRNA(Ala) deacylase